MYFQMAKRQDVINWVSRAWEGISVDLIRRSFKACGISNALDGSEDELVTAKLARALQVGEAQAQAAAAAARPQDTDTDSSDDDGDDDFSGFESDTEDD